MNDDDDDDDDDEEDDESDEDDSDDDGPRSSKKRKKGGKNKKKKKPRHGGFILDEAEVDDEIDDDEEWEDGPNHEIIDNKTHFDESSHRDMDSHRRLQMMWNSQREDEIEDYYRKKYAEQPDSVRGYGEGDGDVPDDITQQALMPGVKDPNLWMVKCKIGEEKQTALHLLRKFIAFAKSDDPLQIKSIVAPEGIKGYVYIEAYKQSHVKQAIQSIGNLRLGQYKQTMVPITEMTEVLKVARNSSSVKAGQWVRLKRGLFKDDIAKVDYTDWAQNTIHLKLLPRVDYTKLRGALRNSENDKNDKKKRFKRPAQKLFDVDAIKAIGGEVTNDGDFMIFESNRYRRGFLHKGFNINAVQFDGVKPTLSELEKFEEHPEGIH